MGTHYTTKRHKHRDKDVFKHTSHSRSCFFVASCSFDYHGGDRGLHICRTASGTKCGNSCDCFTQLHSQVHWACGRRGFLCSCCCGTPCHNNHDFILAKLALPDVNRRESGPVGGAFLCLCFIRKVDKSQYWQKIWNSKDSARSKVDARVYIKG